MFENKDCLCEENNDGNPKAYRTHRRMEEEARKSCMNIHYLIVMCEDGRFRC